MEFDNVVEMDKQLNYKVYVYIHVCCINNWEEVVGDLFRDIKQSGLYDKIDEIRCGVLSENLQRDLHFFNDTKIKIIGFSNEVKLYETSTINTLYNDALIDNMRTCDTYVLYLHSKGVTRPNNLCVKDWVKYMKYFNIYKHNDCLNKLIDGYDAVGVNYTTMPKMHFSGNFWWSSFNHIRKLKKCEHTYYFAPEMWICSRQEGQYHSFFNSHINHYYERYNENLYVKNI